MSSRTLAIVAAVGAILTIGALFIGASALATSESTEGLVIGTSFSECQVEFTTADGQVITTDVSGENGSECRFAEEGEQVSVYYDPDNPEDATTTGTLRRWGWAAFMIVFGPVLFIGGLKTALAQRKST